MVKYFISLASGVIMGAASISAATALPSTTSMREDGYALAPFSFAKFCIDYPGECPASGGASRVVLTASRMAQLAEVNRAVNAAITPTPDTSKLRYWHLNVAAGDCNSFAIQKRHELLRRGWPAGALALTVAKTVWGEGHLIVTVRTDQGDLVLDNLRSRIVSWRQTGYHYIMRQASNNPQFWVELNGGQVGERFAARRLDGTEDAAEAARPVVTADAGPAARPARAGKPLDLRLVAQIGPAHIDTDENASSEQTATAPVAAAAEEPIAQDVYGRQIAHKSGKGGELVENVSFWLKRTNLALADLAPTMRGLMTNLARLADTRIVADAPPVATTVASLASPIDPMEYGFM
jgi:predicted transglutaminase-like cysteine proteinase